MNRPKPPFSKVEKFEREAKKRLIDEPGRLTLLIVVDKLLTGFDAPPATYLYIDKEMRDHGLFQAICRVNRLDGADKEYGYIIDYKDLFHSLEGAVLEAAGGISRAANARASAKCSVARRTMSSAAAIACGS